jgi:hypothetical protein
MGIFTITGMLGDAFLELLIHFDGGAAVASATT